MIHATNFDPILSRMNANPFRGRGGGKGSGGGGDNNTLRSKAHMRLIEVLSEGPIVGLVDGKKSIYLDQTPLLGADGVENFENVIMEEHHGYPDDTPFVGFSAVENTISVDTQVKASSGGVVRTISNPDVTGVKVTVRYPALVKNDSKKGLKKTSVSYAIDLRSYGGDWTEVLKHDENNQKTVSAFQRQFRVKLPSTGAPWDIRVRRITPDSTDDNLQNETWFDSYTTIIEGRFTYPYTAAVAIEVNAEDMGSSMPARVYDVEGLIVSVPSNYDARLRKYVGVWNGTFKQSWTDNPAWIFYDLIKNDRYGLGEFIDADMIDKWSLYTIAQYCDQLVPSGFRDQNGNDVMEPRFTYNGVIQNRDEAFFVLQSITRAWRGMAFWAIGQVFATADMPADPVKLVTPANVINGEFEYSSTAIKARHSVVMVTWNNPDNFYQSEIEPVIDSKLLHKYNWREKQVTLEGCTSRGLAHRYGKWIIDSEQHETETLTYQASWDHADLRPGDLIAVSDPTKAMIRAGGRVVSHSGNEITLDADFEANAGESYWLMMTMPDGSVEKRPIGYWIDDNICVVSQPFSATALANAMFTITGTDIVPRQYRVLSIEEEEANIFRVTALQHDPQKYDRIEKGIVFDPLPYNRPDKTAKPPTGLKVTENGYVSNGKSFHTLTCSWTPPTNQTTRGYYITVDDPDGNTITLGFTENTSIDLDNVTGGLYTFKVQSINYVGTVSKAATFDFEAAGPEGFAKPSVEYVQLIDNPGSTEFTSRRLSFEWKNKFPTSMSAISGETDSYSPYYRANRVRIYRASDDVLLREAMVVGTQFTYEFEANESDNLAKGGQQPARNLRVAVSVLDTVGRESNPVSVVFNNPPPAAISPIYNVWENEIWLGYTKPTDADFEGVMMWVEEESGYDPATTAPAYEGPNNPHTFKLDYESVYYVRIAAYDAFGKTGLNYSSEVPITTLSSGADMEPPKTPTGLAAVSKLVNGRVRMTVTWNKNSESDLAEYDLQIAQAGGNFVSFLLTETMWESDVLPGVVYTIKLRARDKNANSSPFTDEIRHEAAKDVTPPGAITNARIAIGLTSLWLNWTNPSDDDLDHIEVWEAAENDFTKAELVGVTAGNSFPRTGLDNQVERFYWLVAVDTSGNKSAVSAVVSGTTAEMPDAKRVTTVGFVLKPNEPDADKVSWDAFQISFGKPGGVVTTENVEAGNATWPGDDLYLYYVEGTNTLRSTTSVSTMFLQYGHPLAVYRGGTDVELSGGKTLMSGKDIIAGTIGAEQLIANAAIITGTAQIADAIITSAKIVELDAAKIKAGSVLSETVVVGDGGDALKDIADKANDPAGQINKGTTIIQPGKVQINGKTTLSSWISGSDNTSIDGGKLATGSVKANSAEFGMRGITVDGITFEHNSPSANRVSWTAGAITYVDDDGSFKTANITASNAAWTAGTLWLYWVKGETVIRATTVYATANATNNIILATYKGTVFLFAAYGRTIVDGGQIKTQSIQTEQLAAGAVTAQVISVTSLSAISSNLGDIRGGSLNIADKFIVNSAGLVTVRSAVSGARLELTSNRLLIVDNT